MKITAEALCGKKIGFFGLGKSNLALLSALPLNGCEINLRSDGAIDRGSLPRLSAKYRFFEGKRALCDINEDIIFFSPSARRDRRELSEALGRGVIFSSDAELFFQRANAPIYAVSGSDGKSTTATLAAMLLSESAPTELVGNVGVPMLSSISDGVCRYVAELSSFMLTYSLPRVKRGCITNITPNHLDWHKSFEEYRDVKLSLLLGAEEEIISFDDEILREYASGRKIFGVTSAELPYSELKRRVCAEVYVTLEDGRILLNGDALLSVKSLKRHELYNIKNLMSAIALSFGEVTEKQIARVAESFTGLPHRCAYVGRYGDIDYYDSSIDSTPSRAAETLRSLGRRCVVILGGRGKGVSYSPLTPALESYAECAVICGECADDIYKEVKGACRTVTVDDFDSAVDFARELGKGCGCVVLSPAATSYDTFKDYKMRGERFRDLITKPQDFT